MGMKSLPDFCWRVEMAAVEIGSLIGFLGILGAGLYLECKHLISILGIAANPIETLGVLVVMVMLGVLAVTIARNLEKGGGKRQASASYFHACAISVGNATNRFGHLTLGRSALHIRCIIRPVHTRSQPVSNGHAVRILLWGFRTLKSGRMKRQGASRNLSNESWPRHARSTRAPVRGRRWWT